MTSQSENISTLADASLAHSLNISFPSISIKLDHDNYYLWRTTINAALEAFELESFILNDPPISTTAVSSYSTASGAAIPPSPSTLSWPRRDKLVLLWLRSTVTDRLLGNINSAKTTREAWLILERIFQSQSRARVMQIRMQLQTLTKGSKSIVEYVEQKQRLADTLAANLQPISSDDMVGYILMGLGDEYSAFYTSILTRTEPISVDDLLGMLLQEEEHLDRSRNQLLQANVATVHSGRSQSHEAAPHNTYRGRGRGNRGRGRGAHHQQQRSNGQHTGSFTTSRPQGPHRPRIQCQICTKFGHSAIQCYNRFNHAYVAKNASNISALLAEPDRLADTDWYFDSGASNHITADLNNLSIHGEYTGNEKVAVGNGSSASPGTS